MVLLLGHEAAESLAKACRHARDLFDVAIWPNDASKTWLAVIAPQQPFDSTRGHMTVRETREYTNHRPLREQTADTCLDLLISG